MMRLSIATTLVAVIATANAFKDTSPFILFSSSPLPSSISPLSKNQLQLAGDILTQTDKFLATCPSDIYLIISQPQLSASDLRPENSIPFLRQALGDASVQTKNAISEVVGLDGSSVERLVKTIKECGVEIVQTKGFKSLDEDLFAQGKKTLVMSSFEALPSDKVARATILAQNDAGLFQEFLKELPQDHKYTVIYITSPVLDIVQESDTYDPVFQEAIHMDLKRDVRIRAADSTVDRRPLFEKYNYFSPGLFMGLSVTLLLLSILSVGLRALGSLQVSYGAFEKEMGPAAQRKQ